MSSNEHNNSGQIDNCEFGSIELTPPPFAKNTILIGIGALEKDLRCDGDILIGTPDNKVLFSKGVMYFNGEQVGLASDELLDTIRVAMALVARQLTFPIQ